MTPKKPAYGGEGEAERLRRIHDLVMLCAHGVSIDKPCPPCEKELDELFASDGFGLSDEDEEAIRRMEGEGGPSEH